MPSHEDAQLILKLYDLRREETMRAARKWWFSFPWPATLADFQRTAPVGSQEHAYFRMVASYWDMAASFVVKGILDRDLFFISNNQELLYIYLKMRHLFADLRGVSKNLLQYKSLETVGEWYVEWANTHSPEFVDAFRARAMGTAAPAAPVTTPAK